MTRLCVSYRTYLQVQTPRGRAQAKISVHSGGVKILSITPSRGSRRLGPGAVACPVYHILYTRLSMIDPGAFDRSDRGTYQRSTRGAPTPASDTRHAHDKTYMSHIIKTWPSDEGRADGQLAAGWARGRFPTPSGTSGAAAVARAAMARATSAATEATTAAAARRDKRIWRRRQRSGFG